MRLRRLVAAASLPVLLTACSSRTSRPAEVGSRRYSMPAPGEVRLLYRKSVDQRGTVLHTWTILGERNWTRPRIAGGTVSLGGAYPLNSAVGSGGTHVWECTLRVPASKSAAAPAQIGLRGSHAGGVSAVLEAPRGGSSSDAILPVVTKDLTLRLPGRLTLARVFGQEIVLSIER